MGDHKALVNSTRLRTALLGGSILALAYMPTGAMAQEERNSTSATSQSEIIVTARKRDETAIDVPAAITALGAADLDRYGTRDFSGLQKQVPGLMLADIPSNSGGAIALRGLSSSPNNPAIDQTVAINIDGVQVGSGAIIRLGQFDIQQVEVLKGPQALFFGKNSPAGVVSFRSADPGDSLEVKGSVDYEFNAREWGGQVAVGGPLTETLGARIAIAGTTMKGWIKNNAQVFPGFTFEPNTRRSPKKDEIAVRGTLLFKPSSEFTARLKYTYSHMKADSDIFDRQQRIACPYGAQHNGYPGVIDCKADDVTTNGGQDPRLIALVTPFIPDYINGGKFRGTGQEMTQHLASLELNYEIVPDITVTSVSGYYKIDDFFSGTAMYQSAGGLTNMNPSTRRELSQEIRLVTAKDEWPVNFAMGAYYQDTKITNANVSAIDLYALTKGASSSPGAACGACSESDYISNGKTLSAFGQVIVKPIEQIEIAGGVRYTEEKKDVEGFLNGVQKTNYAVDHVKFKNWSPEVTVRYRPNQDWTVFGAWRNGFKSGGFNTGNGSAVPSVTRIDYRPEKVKGFEAGIKYGTRTFSANLTAYTYKYRDLQVATFDPISLSQRLINAANATLKGIEGDFQWRTPVDGLELRGSFNYNKARYKSFLAGCYAGQLVSEGCNLTPNAALLQAIAGGFDPSGNVPFPMVNVGGVMRQAQYQNQNMSGRPLVLAPDWTGSLGFSYTHPVGNSLEFGFSSDALYSSSFYGQLEEAPQGKQQKYVNLDASIFVGAQDGTWRLALIGRNLTEVYRSRFVSQTPLTGIASRAGTNIPGGLPDFSGNVNRGREIRVQGSFKF